MASASRMHVFLLQEHRPLINPATGSAHHGPDDEADVSTHSTLTIINKAHIPFFTNSTVAAFPLGEARCRCRKVWLTRIDYYYYSTVAVGSSAKARCTR
jgi:hypothetical protein